MLKNPFGYLLYLFLRNDYSWSLLSDKEKARVLNANKGHNTAREDYANPEEYGAKRFAGGENWDSFKFDKNNYRSNALLELLEHNKPIRVLEIGPGAGFHTRLICMHPSVRHYAGIDIGQAFLDYLEPRLEKMKEEKDLTSTLICGEAAKITLPGKYDLIVLFSTVHHIPNRMDLFCNLNNLLSEDGIIFCCDPSHYLPRIINLIKKCIFRGYLKRDHYLNKYNMATHHMCSYGEYKKIIRKLPSLKIENVFYQLPEKTRNINWLFFPKQWFSKEIAIILKKTSQTTQIEGHNEYRQRN